MKRSPFFFWLSTVAIVIASLLGYSEAATASSTAQVTAQGIITFPSSLTLGSSSYQATPLSTTCPTSTTCFQLGAVSTLTGGPTPNLKSGLASLVAGPTHSSIQPGVASTPGILFSYVEEIINGTPSSQWILSQLTTGSTGQLSGSYFLGTGISCTSVSNCEVIGSMQQFGSSYSSTQPIDLSHFDGSTFSTPLDVGSATQSSGNLGLPHINCPNSGLCVGTAFSDTIIVQNGSVTLDPISNHLNVGSQPSENQLSCSNAGLCGILGSYRNSSGIQASFVETYKNGVFQNLQTLGDNASVSSSEIEATGISCTDSSACEITGLEGGSLPPLSLPVSGVTSFVASVTNGTLGTLIPLTAPISPIKFIAASSISCGFTGDCVVGGLYSPESSSSSGTIPDSFYATLQNGVQTTTSIPFDTSITASYPLEVACQGNLACTAFTLSTPISGSGNAISISLISITNGLSSPPVTIASSSSSNINVVFDTVIASILANPLACGPAANCELGYMSAVAGQQYGLTAFVNFSPSTQGVALSPLGLINGYRIAGADGSVYSYGTSQYLGGANGSPLAGPIVSIINTPDDLGYWLIGADGGVFAYGDAKYMGSPSQLHISKPIVGAAVTPDGQGYWLVGADGGVFAYGDATFYGSVANLTLNKPIVAIASTPDGGGYWMVASDGGVFAYGDAKFYGSAATLALNKPIVGIASTPDGGGYWMVASDGGIFAYGDAKFYGSATNLNLNKPIDGIMASPDGAGYFLVAGDGGVFAYGDAAFQGSTGGNPPMTTIESISY